MVFARMDVPGAPFDGGLPNQHHNWFLSMPKNSSSFLSSPDVLVLHPICKPQTQPISVLVSWLTFYFWLLLKIQSEHQSHSGIQQPVLSVVGLKPTANCTQYLLYAIIAKEKCRFYPLLPASWSCLHFRSILPVLDITEGPKKTDLCPVY